jgi:hypothetical protein
MNFLQYIYIYITKFLRKKGIEKVNLFFKITYIQAKVLANCIPETRTSGLCESVLHWLIFILLLFEPKQQAN